MQLITLPAVPFDGQRHALRQRLYGLALLFALAWAGSGSVVPGAALLAGWPGSAVDPSLRVGMVAAAFGLLAFEARAGERLAQAAALAWLAGLLLAAPRVLPAAAGQAAVVAVLALGALVLHPAAAMALALVAGCLLTTGAILITPLDRLVVLLGLALLLEWQIGRLRDAALWRAASTAARGLHLAAKGRELPVPLNESCRPVDPFTRRMPAAGPPEDFE